MYPEKIMGINKRKCDFSFFFIHKVPRCCFDEKFNSLQLSTYIEKNVSFRKTKEGPPFNNFAYTLEFLSNVH